MKKKKIDFRQKLFLLKETIAELNENGKNKALGGALTQGRDCMTPAYTIPFQTVCCPSWPPDCSVVISCLG